METFHNYEKGIKFVLQRINPEKYGFDTRQQVRGVKAQPLNLTQKNKDLLDKYYADLINEGLTAPRILSVLSQTSRVLEWLGKDWDQLTPEDIKTVTMKIRQSELSEYTKADYFVKIKRFDKWVNGGEEYTELTKKVKTSVKSKDLKLPSQLINPEEAKQLINSTQTARDRALISLIWETGARIGEIGNLKMKNLEFNKGECRITLIGKTGSRRVLLLECVRDLQNYVKLRNVSSLEDPLFVLEGNRGKGEQITYTSIKKVLTNTLKRSGLKKHIYAHLFRHSRATYLASKGLSEAQLCSIFGWVIGSKQTRTYIHLSGAQVEEVYKRLYGLSKPQEEIEAVIKCQTCGEINSSSIDVCQNCYNPLTIKGALSLKRENDHLQEAVQVQTQVNALAFELIQQGFNVQDAKQQAVNQVAEQFANKLKEEQKIKALV